MSSITENIFRKIKQEIKNMYLSGESVSSIAKHFNVIPRNIYHHLGKLTPEEKGLHAMNLSLKQSLRKEAYGKNRKSTSKKVKSDLDDFEQ